MLTYAIVTPARNEARNLERLAECLSRQSLLPEAWIIVDDGSTDRTASVISQVRLSFAWISMIDSGGSTEDGGELELGRQRGREARAFTIGIAELVTPPDVVVKVDADISVEDDYFELLIAAFDKDDALGIASGTALELVEGTWQQRHLTGESVWGASRAYRWECLKCVEPLEERLSWDYIDEMKARAQGWHTRTLTDLPFLHHRPEGIRDGNGLRRWREVGRSSHYLHYRPSYLLARTAYHARSDLAAVAIIWGYASSEIRQEPRLADAAARKIIRQQQRVRHLPQRRRQVLGRSRD